MNNLVLHKVSSESQFLVLLPHYDDEVFVILPLLQKHISKNKIIFVFIIKDKSGVRKKESLQFLQSYGFSSDQVVFLDEFISVCDGEVIQHIRSIETCLLENLGAIRPEFIVAPAWEGGHQDHDACYILSNRLALVYKCKSVHYCTYTGYGTQGKFFNVLKPIANEVSYSPLTLAKVSLIQICMLLFRIRFFRSQLKTWIGLLPLLLLRLLLIRKIPMLTGDIRVSQKPPHAGLLLYERYARMTYEQFNKYLEAIK